MSSGIGAAWRFCMLKKTHTASCLAIKLEFSELFIRCLIVRLLVPSLVKALSMVKSSPAEASCKKSVLVLAMTVTTPVFFNVA